MTTWNGREGALRVRLVYGVIPNKSLLRAPPVSAWLRKKGREWPYNSCVNRRSQSPHPQPRLAQMKLLKDIPHDTKGNQEHLFSWLDSAKSRRVKKKIGHEKRKQNLTHWSGECECGLTLLMSTAVMGSGYPSMGRTSQQVEREGGWERANYHWIAGKKDAKVS